MTAALCIVFGFVVGVFSGGMVLMIAGNKLITKQLVAEQTKLNAELCSDQGNALLPKEENAYKSPRIDWKALSAILATRLDTFK